jgi:nucleotide-binding universal stress UspA family protein
LDNPLQQDQENRVRAERVMESPILVKALELLGQTGFPLDRVTLKFGHEDDIAHTLLDEARTGGYGTIVVSRHGSNVVKRLFGGGITDQLLRDASGYTLGVVE